MMWGLPMQVLVRRELEEAAKVLGERIRTNDASPEVLGPWPVRYRRLQGPRKGHARENSVSLAVGKILSFQCSS